MVNARLGVFISQSLQGGLVKQAHQRTLRAKQKSTQSIDKRAAEPGFITTRRGYPSIFLQMNSLQPVGTPAGIARSTCMPREPSRTVISRMEAYSYG